MSIIQSLIGRQAGGGPDPSWNQVVSLLWFNGNLTDQRGKSWAAVNGAATSSVQSRFGGASLRLDNTSQYIQSPSSPDWDFGANESFCVEGWFWFDSFSGSNLLFWRDGLIPNPNGGIQIRVDGNGRIFVDQFNVGNVLFGNSGPAITAGAWTHIAVARDGASIRSFVNGQLTGGTGDSRSFAANGPATAVVGIGLAGYVDDFRVTKGAARYTSDFTPPAFQAPNF